MGNSINVLVLKIIAVVTMIIDHYGAIFESGEIIYRIIGRLAFPIFAFLISEGFVHTSNVKKYGLRLLTFAFISEIPFDYAINGRLGLEHQNIFFTLFLGILTLYLLKDRKELSNSNKYLLVISIGGLSSLLRFDYGIIGIIYMVSFYLTREFQKNKRFAILFFIMFITNLLTSTFIQQFSLGALLILYFYNGKLGPKHRAIQVFFYIVYPLHLIIFALMRF